MPVASLLQNAPSLLPTHGATVRGCKTRFYPSEPAGLPLTAMRPGIRRDGALSASNTLFLSYTELKSMRLDVNFLILCRLDKF
jgi:hypothetical protein